MDEFQKGFRMDAKIYVKFFFVVENILLLILLKFVFRRSSLVDVAKELMPTKYLDLVWISISILGLSTSRARSVLGPTRTRPAGVKWRGRGTRNWPPEKSVESISGGGERRSVRSVVEVKKIIGIWKKKRSPKSGKSLEYLHFFLSKSKIFH